LFRINQKKGGENMNAENSQGVAGFESIFDSPVSSNQGPFVDSWDDCHDCDYNCDGET